MPQSRRIAVIMFSDIVGYTALMGANEQDALTLLKKNKYLHQRLLKQFNGQLLKEIGDGILASFETITDAVYCAGMLIQETQPIDGFDLHIGIHAGEVVIEGKELYGNGINIASRIEGKAKSGQVLVSEMVYNNIRNKPEIKTTYINELFLKNVSRPVKVYAIEVEKIPVGYKSGSTLKFKNKYGWWAVLAAAVLGIIFLVQNISKQSELAEDRLLENSIAVLPFTNMSDNQDQEYFCAGMTDQILTNLASIPELLVVGRTSVMKFKNTDLTIPEIAEQLHVDYILEAGVQKIGDDMRINAQLIKADGFHIWAEKFDRSVPQKMLFDIQDELSEIIAKSISEKLDFKLEHDTRPNNSQAYDYFIEAKFIAINDYYSKYDSVAFKRAYSLYEKAIDLDPNFALAYSGLADLLDARFNGVYTGLTDPPKEYDSLRTAYAIKGYQLDPKAAFTNYMKGILADKSGDRDSAFYYNKRAIQLSPKDPYYYYNICQVYGGCGLFEQALSCVEKAIELDPLNPNSHGLRGAYQIKLGFVEEGFQSFHRAMEMEENKYNVQSHFRYVRALLIYGDKKEAIAFIEGREKAGLPIYPILKELLYIANGEYDKVTHKHIILAALMNDKEGFFSAWDNYFISNPNFCDYLTFIKNPLFEPFKSDPRFAKMLERDKKRYDDFTERWGELPF